MVSAREGRRARAFPLYAVVLAIGVLLVVLLVGWLAWIDAQASHDKALRTSRVYGAHVESVLGDHFHKPACWKPSSSRRTASFPRRRSSRWRNRWERA